VPKQLYDYFYIYKITNNINGKIYIGQTNNPYQRFAQYKSAVKSGNMRMVIYRALIKYKIENFIFEVIATCKTLDDLNYTETLIIQQCNSRDPNIGYNIDEGGGSATRTPETCKNVSEGLKKFYETHESKLKGSHSSEETKRKISESSMGKPGTNTGKTFSDEWKKKISEAHIGKKCSPETIERLSKLRVGKAPVNRKLTFEIAEIIREEFNTNHPTIISLAKKYNVSDTTMLSLLRGETYKKKEEIKTAEIKEINNDNIIVENDKK
jgi:group I intron endonuclease